MTLSNIEITNIRGISNLKIDKIYKNVPNILVASNGFGKTSIAKAFQSIADQTYIKLSDDLRHQHNEAHKAKISLELDHELLSANESAHSNEIRKRLDIYVISDMRKVKASSRNINGFTRATAKQVIDPIVICKKIDSTANPYNYRTVCNSLNLNNIPNINNVLFKDESFIMLSVEILGLLTPLTKYKNQKDLEIIRKNLETNLNNENQINNQIELFLNKNNITNLFSNITDNLITKIYLILQLVHLIKENKELIIEYAKFLRYKAIKNSLKEHINNLNMSWKIAKVREKNENLIVEMPDPTHISNGQRDIILLVAMFHMTKYNLTKEKSIIIIDEIFDYLDDANLTVAQFYISELIETHKRQGRSIYPIILTHLNPSFFNNYVFKNQKVTYLDKANNFQVLDAMKKLLAARKNDLLEPNIAKYLVHYHSEEFDFSEELKCINGIRSNWGKTDKFKNDIEIEFQKYKKNECYDPFAICAITRRSIEYLAYQQIKHLPNHSDFFSTHGTTPKLDLACLNNAHVPESHYLLRIIFDDGLHWNPNRDNTIPIVAKLTNPIIKKLIINIVDQALTN